MTQRPFVSFIVPVYNVEQYLCRCVDSVISQTCGDWELVLIDDGSMIHLHGYVTIMWRRTAV